MPTQEETSKLAALENWFSGLAADAKDSGRKVLDWAKENLDKIDLNDNGQPDFTKATKALKEHGSKIIHGEEVMKNLGQLADKGIAYVKDSAPVVAKNAGEAADQVIDGGADFMKDNKTGLMGGIFAAIIGAMMFGMGPIGALIIGLLGFAAGNMLGDGKKGLLGGLFGGDKKPTDTPDQVKELPAVQLNGLQKIRVLDDNGKPLADGEFSVRVKNGIETDENKKSDILYTGKLSKNGKEFEISTVSYNYADGRDVFDLKAGTFTFYDQNGKVVNSERAPDNYLNLIKKMSKVDVNKGHIDLSMEGAERKLSKEVFQQLPNFANSMKATNIHLDDSLASITISANINALGPDPTINQRAIMGLIGRIDGSDLTHVIMSVPPALENNPAVKKMVGEFNDRDISLKGVVKDGKISLEAVNSVLDSEKNTLFGDIRDINGKIDNHFNQSTALDEKPLFAFNSRRESSTISVDSKAFLNPKKAPDIIRTLDVQKANGTEKQTQPTPDLTKPAQESGTTAINNEPSKDSAVLAAVFASNRLAIKSVTGMDITGGHEADHSLKTPTHISMTNSADKGRAT